MYNNICLISTLITVFIYIPFLWNDKREIHMKLRLLFTTTAIDVLIANDFYTKWQDGGIGHIIICQYGMAEKK